MNEKFLEFREKYSDFIYDSYQIVDNSDYIEISYKFIIPNLEIFNPKIKIPKTVITRYNLDYNFIKNISFNLGMVEAISYFKCVCSPNIIIKCGKLNIDQINWYKKLYYNSLGEFLYRNKIEVEMEEFVNFIIDNNDSEFEKISFESFGNLIPIGGGKDSCVSLEILKNEKNNACFLMNAKKPMLECAKMAGYNNDNIYCIERIFDKEKIVNLNNLGYLNGHTPISAVIAFVSYLTAYLSGKKNIILSNESSANESYVKDKKVNHQYSKSYEFEHDFYDYTTKYFSDSIKYFSLLRPLSELQISYIFSKLKNYHSIFKSCNMGSKGDSWNWCLNCSKCLFIYLVLSPFLTYEELINIFGENLFDKQELLNDFIDLVGDSEHKPFDCVGTYDDVNYCVNKIINKYLKENNDLPILLNYYYKKHGIKDSNDNLLYTFNENNNLDTYYKNLVKDYIKNI